MAKYNRKGIFFDRKTNEFVGITEEAYSELQKLYPHIDIAAQLSRMKVWLVTNPKGANRIGNIQFITNWLNNSQPTSVPIVEKENTETPLRPMINEYLQDLWNQNNAQAIITLNTEA